MSDGPKRLAMTPGRKRRIWERDLGLCWVCNQPVPETGDGVRYDHRVGFWMKDRDDREEDISPSHTESCDKKKTALDQGRIAKTKRLINKADPETRKPSRMKSRPFPTGGPKRKIQSRGFQ